MAVTREETIKMLDDYLAGRMSKETVYQWALKIVISDEFEKLRIKDELLSDAIHALFDLHHEGEEEKYNPSMEDLEDYKTRLKNKIEFKR